MEEKNYFRCPFCAFKSDSESACYQHYVKKHRTEEEFAIKCSLCDGDDSTVYKTSGALKQHLRRTHDITTNTGYGMVSGPLPSGPSSSNSSSALPPQVSDVDAEITQSSEPIEVQYEQNNTPLNIDSEDAGQDSDDSTSSMLSSTNYKDNDNTDTVDDGGHPEPLCDKSKWQSAKFLLNLREEAMVSQSAVDKAKDGIDDLFGNYIQEIKDHLLKGFDAETGISEEHILSTFEKFQENGLFSDLESKEKLDKFSKEFCTFIEPQKVELYTTEFTDKKGKIRVKSHNAYVCQFLPGLKRLLTRPDILECIDNPVKHTDGVYKTYQDGSYARNHPILSEAENLGIQLCYDDLEISSPLGPKKYKLSLYYWSLSNLQPHMRGSLKAINIAAIVNHTDLSPEIKQIGQPFMSLDAKFHVHCKVLAPFLKDIQLLEKGIKVETDRGEREFKGTLQSVTGDSPAVNVLGGFKESVGPAHKPCHVCLVDHHEMKAIFKEEFFEKRSESNRKIQLDSVLKAKTVQEREYQSTLTGYNGLSCISGLDSFNQISCFLFDTMHILMEGVLEAHMRCLLDYCVNEKNLYSINDINQEVKNLAVQLPSEDRPAPIKSEHLKGSIRQSASQMLRLATLLPIFMAVKPELTERLSNFALLLRITYGLLQHEVTDSDIKKLKTMIENHNLQFIVDYPNFSVTPKFHFLIHLPSQIEQFGPARYTWSMRYEAMHSYIKSIMRIIKNFKNPPKSCTFRYESLRACQMLTPPGEAASEFLSSKDKRSGVKRMKLKDYKLSHLITPLFGSPNLSINVCAKLVTRGVAYSAGSVVLLKGSIPFEFAEIKDIVSYVGINVLVLCKLQCGQFSTLTNSFTVTHPSKPDYEVAFIENLDFFQPLLKLNFRRLIHLVPKYHNLILCED